MSRKIAIGTEVKITSGMKEFVDKVGTIIDNTESDGKRTMYRVRFEQPVEVGQAGMVRDDLWESSHFRVVRKKRVVEVDEDRLGFGVERSW